MEDVIYTAEEAREAGRSWVLEAVFSQIRYAAQRGEVQTNISNKEFVRRPFIREALAKAGYRLRPYNHELDRNEYLRGHTFISWADPEEPDAVARD